MNSTLRPMTLGEILDRTFQIYRTKFFTFIWIAAIPAFAIIFIEIINRVWWGMVPFPYDGDISLFLLQWTVYITALYQIALLLRFLFWPASVCLTSQIYFGERSQLTALSFRGNSSWRRWIWTAIANWGIILIFLELIIFGLFLGFYYFCTEVVKISETTEEWLMPDLIYILFALGYLAFYWLSSALFVAIPVKSLERLTIGKSLRRSWTLSKGSRWKIIFVRLGLVLTGWLANLSLSAVLILLLRWIMTSFGVWWHYYRNLFNGIGFLAAFIVSLLIGPIFPIALTLFYYDQRIRQEGYDIERMMESAGMIVPVTPALIDDLVKPDTVEGQA
jgi:hypothetical protein